MNNQEIKQKLEDISKSILKSHIKTIFYNEGDLLKLESNINKKLIKAFNLGITLSAENAMVSNSQTNQVSEGWNVKQGERWNSKDVEFKVWKDSIFKLLIK